MQVFSTTHFPFGNALEVELYFWGKTFVFRAQTIAGVTWVSTQKKRELPLHTTLLTKVFGKSAGQVWIRALLLTLLHLRIYFKHQDRLIYSRRFIDESSRKSESLI